MPDPFVASDSNGEWLELYNAGTTPVNLRNWKLQSPNPSPTTPLHSFSIAPLGSAPVMIPAGGYFVLARKAPVSANVPVVGYDYPDSFSLLNDSPDGIILFDSAGIEHDRVFYNSTWPFSEGRSMQLKSVPPGVLDNSVSANWCKSTMGRFGATVITSLIPFRTWSDFGTPGSANDCPP